MSEPVREIGIAETEELPTGAVAIVDLLTARRHQLFASTLLLRGRWCEQFSLTITTPDGAHRRVPRGPLASCWQIENFATERVRVGRRFAIGFTVAGTGRTGHTLSGIVRGIRVVRMVDSAAEPVELRGAGWRITPPLTGMPD